MHLDLHCSWSLPTHIILYESSCAHEQSTWSICIVGTINGHHYDGQQTYTIYDIGHVTQFEAYWNSISPTLTDLLCLRVALMPRSQNLVIFCGQRQQQNWLLHPLVHARGATYLIEQLCVVALEHGISGVIMGLQNQHQICYVYKCILAVNTSFHVVQYKVELLWMSKVTWLI